MKPDQQRKIFEAAAKACGWHIDGLAKDYIVQGVSDHALLIRNNKGGNSVFDPIDNSADTASMCAKLDISTIWHFDKIVECADQWRGIYHAVPHDGTTEGKEAAWRLAASMVAAKVGGYSDE